MMEYKMYAQFDENHVCTCVGTPNISGVEATYENLGMKYIEGKWLEIPKLAGEYSPTSTEIAQMISDLQADLIIAGVI